MVRRHCRHVAITTFLILLAPSARGDDAKQIAFFEAKIRPVLVDKCNRCHSAEAQEKKKLKGGLLVDTQYGLVTGGDSGPAVVPGNVKAGTLLKALHFDGDLKMPPSGKLPEHVLKDFEAWIAAGAADPRKGKPVAARKTIDIEAGKKFWSFQPPKKSPVPSPARADWAWSEIDRFLLAKLDEKKVAPVADAEPHRLLRRLSFDLVGLPPTPEAVAAFEKAVAKDRRAAIAGAVDELLASKAFAEHWARHWLDVARYSDNDGGISNNSRPNMWKYRLWILDAFQNDLPYDQFVAQQIAGDLLPAESEEQLNRQLIATGFLAQTAQPGFMKPEEQVLEVAAEVIESTGRAILGLNISCARCHDHKLDPIPTADYYALAGIFVSTEFRVGPDPIANDSFNVQTLLRSHRALGKEGRGKADTILADRDALPVLGTAYNLKFAKEKLSHLKANGNVKLREKEVPKLEQRIAELEKKLAEQRKKLNRPLPELPEFACGVQDQPKPRDQDILIRGDVAQRGPKSPRGVLQVLSSKSTPSIPSTSSGRRELAQWLTSRDNPLTARVHVNRVWNWLFGKGIVASVDEFGSAGTLPSHPELLDTLAVEFMVDGWSTKRLIRRIVLSRAYQLAVATDPSAMAVDPDNTYLWRAHRRHLQAEQYRDAVLSISGQLDSAPVLVSPVAQRAFTGQSMTELIGESRSRSIYQPILRDAVPDIFALFDTANPYFVTGSRRSSLLATQALFVLNSPFMMDQSKAFANRLLNLPGSETERLTRAFHLAYGRAPRPDEEATFLKSLARMRERTNAKTGAEAAAWQAVCQVLLASAEFRFLD